MKKDNIWDKYMRKLIIEKGTYGPVYKAYDLNSHNYVAIKEIDKIKYKQIINSQFKENLEKINSKNFLKDIIKTNNKDYIIMDLCLCNLKDYINIINDPLSIDEIKEILIELNKILKIAEKENIIFKDLKPSNILISFTKSDEIKINLCKITKNELMDKTKSNMNNIERICLTTAPEILKGESISKQSDLWSLGIIIYYMIFKEYPYNGKNEYQIIKQINSNKILKHSGEKELDDLINRMLKINDNERITWDNYFNHNFFKNDFQNKELIKEFNQIKIEESKINDVKIVIYNDQLIIDSKI